MPSVKTCPKRREPLKAFADHGDFGVGLSDDSGDSEDIVGQFVKSGTYITLWPPSFRMTAPSHL